MGLFKSIFKFIGSIFEFAFGWLIPEPEIQSQSIKTSKVGSNKAIPVNYGENILGAIKIHQYVTDTPKESDNDLLHIIAVFCEGEVQSVDELFFNEISENDKKFKGGRLAGGRWYEKHVYTGTPNQPASAAAVSGIPNWTIDHKLSGLCYAYIVLQLPHEESDARREVWKGEPQISARIKGKKVYDPRTGTTVYSANPALCIRDFITNPIYGLGLPESFVVDSEIVRIANACDEGVSTTQTITEYKDLSGGEPGVPPVPVTTTETINHPRFSCNLVLQTDTNPLENFNKILRTFRGIVQDMTSSAKLSYETTIEETYGAGTTVDDLFHFNADTMLDDFEFDSGDIKDRFNVVEVKFRNRLKEFEEDSVFYPDDSDPLKAQWLAEDNGIEQKGDFNVSGITSKAEALQWAEIVAKRSRFTKSVSVTGMPITIKVEVGDIVAVDSQMNGWTKKPFRVMEKELQDDDSVAFKLREHEDAIYPWSGRSFSDTVGGTWLGDPNNLAPVTGITLTPDPTLSKTGTLSWDYGANAFIRGYQVRLKDSLGSVIYDVRRPSRSWLVPLIDAGSYVAEVYAVSTTGATSPTAAYAFTLAAPVQPSSITLTPRDWEIEAAAQLAGIGLGTVFEYDIVAGDGVEYTPTSRGRATTFTFTGLLPDTLYTVFARAINAYGISDWVSESATTTNTGAQVDEYLQTIRDELDDVETVIGDINTNLTDITFSINENRINIEDSELVALDSIIQQSGSREELRRRIESGERLIDAAVYVDPETGTIVNRAFQYTDEAFTQVEFLIDGVEAQITATVDDVQLIRGQVNTLSAELELVPGQITATATSIVAEAIQALEPAHTFNFFDSAQGWVAVNGTISTALPNEISVTWGDIENSGLNFVADDNKSIRITIERTGGTGWVGDLIIERDDNTTETYAGIIEDVPAGGQIVRSIDMRGAASWTGTITRVRLVLGASASDEFTIKQIVIGKPDAVTQEIEGLSQRVTTAELNISSNEAAITQVVDDLQTFEDDTADKFTSVESEINAQEGRITNSLFQIVGDSADFEDSTIQALSEQISNAEYRTGQIERNLSFAEAIDQLKVDVSEEGALAKSIDALSATTITQGQAIQANTQLIQQVQTNVNGNASAISVLQGQVNDPANNTSALYQFAQSVKTTADGNASAITNLASRVENNENFASAQLQLNAGYDSDLDELFARAFLGTNVNGAVTGLVIDGVTQQIEFQFNSAVFLDSSSQPMIYFDNVNGRYVFDGDIVARSFTGQSVGAENIKAGAVTAEKLTADAIDGKTIKGAKIIGGTFQSISTSHMIVKSGTPFGPDNLIEWFGPVSGNVSNGEAILSNLSRANATTWKAYNGEYSRDIVTRRAIGARVTTVTHPSQGNQILVDGRGTATYASSFTITGLPPPYYTVTMTILLKRGTTTIASKTVSAPTVPAYENQGGSSYFVMVDANISADIAAAATVGYTTQDFTVEISSVTADTPPAPSSRTYDTSITTTEIRP